ncbi:MAG TPA: DUF2017 domain-containing protein [Phycicoccus sp.]|nr:DUF2017 domain-containing protein [Phycicoccus sp.]
MARGFRRRARRGEVRYAARLDGLERSVLVGLLTQVLDLLDPDRVLRENGSASARSSTRVCAPGDPTPDTFEDIVAGLGDLAGDAAERPIPEDARSFGDRDPALQRLLPSGNRVDEQAAAEFRRLTEDGLRARKVDNLTRALIALRRPGTTLEVEEQDAQAFLVALTDVRLVLGERLSLRDDDDIERLERAADRLPEEHPLVHALLVYDFLTWLQETLAGALLSGTSNS